MSHTPENLLTDWSTLLLTTLADAGVVDVVVSPGSRSTPFVLALLRDPRLRCTSVVDERAAAFFALGQGRLTGRPTALLCTSGSAAAHYYPAVVEAAAAHIPLIMLTADRPGELQECAAPQTIDQVKLFGGYARKFFDLGAPDPSAAALRALRRMVAQAVFASTHPTPGPVHLNARARKPLEPTEPSSPEGERLRLAVRDLLAEPLVVASAPASAVHPTVIADVAARCASSPRGLIVCGPSPVGDGRAHEAILAIARLTGFPVLCEATSQVRFGGAREGVVLCDAFDALFRSERFRDCARPELVLQVGSPPTSAAWERHAPRPPHTKRVIVAPHGWNDPQSDASVLVFAHAETFARELAAALRGENLAEAGGRPAWRRLFARANAAAWAAIDAELSETPGLSEGAATRAVVERAPEGSLLLVGNSMPVRHVDTYAPASARRLDVLCQRGANGIDGLVAGAMGAASAAGRPVTLLLGDVSFLHDLTSLSLARDLRVPVVVVVLQNGGGRIFEMLPLGRTLGYDAPEMAPVVTPHQLDFSHAARLFDHAYRPVRSAAELDDALADAYAGPICTLIEVFVPPHGAVEQNDRVFRRVIDALDLELEREAAQARRP